MSLQFSLFSLGCKSKFFLYNSFLTHYSQEHAAVGIRNKCNKCNEETNLSTLRHHLENCHNIMQAQCIFCKFGSKTFDGIKHHLMDNHPSKLPLFCERAQESNITPSSIDSVPIRYIGVRNNIFMNSKCPNVEYN
jgi:hypothetical protein